jgi:hypothetical protein
MSASNAFLIASAAVALTSRRIEAKVPGAKCQCLCCVEASYKGCREATVGFSGAGLAEFELAVGAMVQGSGAKQVQTQPLVFCLASEKNHMRPLTEEESKAVFSKLANYIVRVFLSIFFSFAHRVLILGQKSSSSHRPSRRIVLL